MEQSNCLTLSKEFLKYCELNKIDDVLGYAAKVFNKGFALDKFGDKPSGLRAEKKIELPIQEEKPKTKRTYTKKTKVVTPPKADKKIDDNLYAE